MIVVKYSSQKEENRHYVDIAQFLAAAGVRVPKIYFHDPEEGLIWMQDLGHDDLWAYRAEPWEIRRPLYEAALTEVARMHTSATAASRARASGWSGNSASSFTSGSRDTFSSTASGRTSASMPPPFNATPRCPRSPASPTISRISRACSCTAISSRRISSSTRARPGSLTSRACAPACRSTTWPRSFTIPTSPSRQRTRPPPRLLSAGARREGLEIAPDFEQVYHECALQRLMQALGAYGFLGLHKGRADFLAHIPAARRSLREVAARLDGLDPFVKLLDSLP